jgi:hypothetical protein
LPEIADISKLPTPPSDFVSTIQSWYSWHKRQRPGEYKVRMLVRYFSPADQVHRPLHVGEVHATASGHGATWGKINGTPPNRPY